MNDTLAGALRSKTMWANGLAIALTGVDFVLSNQGIITSLIPGAGPLIVVISALNMILRLFTSQSLASKTSTE